MTPDSSWLQFSFCNIHVRFQAWSQIKVIGAYLEPVVRTLVDIETSSDLDCPAVTQPNFTIMKGIVFLDLKYDIKQFEAIGNNRKFAHGLVFFKWGIELGDESNSLGPPQADDGLTEPQEVVELVILANLGVLNDDLFGA